MSDRYFNERQRLIEITLNTPRWECDPKLAKEVRGLRKKLYYDGRKIDKLVAENFDEEIYKDLIRRGHMKIEIGEALGWSIPKLDAWAKKHGLNKYQILREAGLIDGE